MAHLSEGERGLVEGEGLVVGEAGHAGPGVLGGRAQQLEHLGGDDDEVMIKVVMARMNIMMKMMMTMLMPPTLLIWSSTSLPGKSGRPALASSANIQPADHMSMLGGGVARGGVVTGGERGEGGGGTSVCRV